MIVYNHRIQQTERSVTSFAAAKDVTLLSAADASVMLNRRLDGT